MGCLNCNIELKHTPGKRKKQFCSPDCRVRYWQKNKPKKEPKSAKEIDRLEELLTWGPEIETFCAKKGFPPSELIEKFEGLEAKNEQLIADKFVGHVLDKWKDSPNKADTAPNPEKEGKTTPKQEKVKEGAENELGKGQATLKQPFLKEIPTAKPKELSNFLKSRQNLKNGIK